MTSKVEIAFKGRGPADKAGPFTEKCQNVVIYTSIHALAHMYAYLYDITKTGKIIIGKFGKRGLTRNNYMYAQSLYIHLKLLTGNYVFMAGVTSIMAQFKSIEPYHWPGWFITAVAVVYAVIVTLTFTEPWPFAQLKGCKCWTGLKLSLELRSGWRIRLAVSFFPCVHVNRNTHCFVYSDLFPY